jgi:NAD(P)-dependent dehydrogenase (short-subunit alcohol dehydrogenase family)
VWGASTHWISTEFSPFAYNLSKFALNRLVEIIHESHHKFGIVVYAIHPGAILTPLVADYPEEWRTGEIVKIIKIQQVLTLTLI